MQPALAAPKLQPPKSNHNTPVKKTDQGPFASAWQQQQCDDVLSAMQHFDVAAQQSPGAQRELSAYFSEEFFDTRSIFSEASLLERQLSDQLLAAAQQALAPVPAPAPAQPQTGPWVPPEPLLFAGEERGWQEQDYSALHPCRTRRVSSNFFVCCSFLEHSDLEAWLLQQLHNVWHYICIYSWQCHQTSFIRLLLLLLLLSLLQSLGCASSLCLQ
jgi:hypothetical protein